MSEQRWRSVGGPSEIVLRIGQMPELGLGLGSWSMANLGQSSSLRPESWLSGLYERTHSQTFWSDTGQERNQQVGVQLKQENIIPHSHHQKSHLQDGDHPIIGGCP